MVRVKHYLDDLNVLEAALKRLRHIFDVFDSVAVCFSGGKDSLATLHLAWQVAQERGLSQVDVIFRDEELIPEQVIAFVDEYRQKPWVKMLYFAVPLAATKYILGRSFDYVQWDPNREHLRPRPAHALILEPGDERVMDQYTMDAYTAQWFTGKCAFVTGIRAAESLMRYRASVNKLNESYINATSTKNVSLCKPLYDWEENDVFRFFFERGIRYCELYNAQHVAGASLRVSTPLHPESAKRFGDLRRISPLFYQQVVTLFPEMLEQERYFSELDRDGAGRP
jgi:predicted phosphoadenosine phosphosulfate sulfurtransferase